MTGFGQGAGGAESPLPRLSVVVPVFDEAESLRPLIAELNAALGFLEGSFEIIFVNDGSLDDSPRVLSEIAAEDPRVRVLSLAANGGQAAALNEGFRVARGEFTATLDADLQNDPWDIEKLMARLDEADVVNGVRVDRHDSWLRILSSRIANALRNALTGEAVSDVGCSLRVMRTSFLRKIVLEGGLHRFLPTLLRLEGARVQEVPVAHRERYAGRSKYGIANRLFEGLRELLVVRAMVRSRRR